MVLSVCGPNPTRMVAGVLASEYPPGANVAPRSVRSARLVRHSADGESLLLLCQGRGSHPRTP
jgi:hypothetical protein